MAAGELTILINDPQSDQLSLKEHKQVAASENNKSIIYSTFGADPSNLYQSAGWTIGGDMSPYDQMIAMSFTPSSTTYLTKIKVAAGTLGGGEVIVAIHEDEAGLPGAQMKKFKADNLPAFGECCDVVKKSFQGVQVLAGKQYWVAVHAAGKNSTFQGGWHFGYSDKSTLAASSGNGWYQITGAAPAFSVLGD